MNEFPPRTEPVASVGSAAERAGMRVAIPAPQSTPRTEAVSGSTSRPASAPDAAEPLVLPNDETSRTFANYSRIHDRIADVVANIGTASPRGEAADLAGAENVLLSLMPQPSVVLPLPPADEDMVAFVAQVTQSIARQAAMTRAALANVAPAAVDAATA